MYRLSIFRTIGKGKGILYHRSGNIGLPLHVCEDESPPQWKGFGDPHAHRPDGSVSERRESHAEGERGNPVLKLPKRKGMGRDGDTRSQMHTGESAITSQLQRVIGPSHGPATGGSLLATLRARGA